MGRRFFADARFRFTLRWLMVAVAVAALVAWGVTLRRASRAYAARAAHHRRLKDSRASVLRQIESSPYKPQVLRWKGAPGQEGQVVTDLSPPSRVPRIWIQGTPDWWKQEVARHATLEAKYERAARYPWLPVAPDPPEPE